MMLTDMADVLRAAGLTVIEHSGWKTRAQTDGNFTPRGILFHHDASAPGPSNYLPDFLADLSHPGAQLWVDYTGRWYTIAAGRMWHAGAGKGWGDIPANAGNTYSFGVETDHTEGEAWAPGQLDSITRGFAALCHAYGYNPMTSVCGHREYAPGLKIDPSGVDMDVFRRNVAALAGGGTLPPPIGITPAPEGTLLMRYANLDNPTGTTPNRTAVLTVDPVGRSLVMPKGARAWLQWEACYPFGGEKAVARMDWLVAMISSGDPNKPAAPKPFDPFPLGHRGVGSIELPAGTLAVELVVRGIPAGGSVGVHIDGIGHG